ncbi:hypothetical protein ES703_15018 [subsurface metagenome]
MGEVSLQYIPLPLWRGSAVYRRGEGFFCDLFSLCEKRSTQLRKEVKEIGSSKTTPIYSIISLSSNHFVILGGIVPSGSWGSKES